MSKGGPGLPQILQDFREWADSVDLGAVLGYFELTDAVPGQGWFGDAVLEQKLAARAREFIHLGDGSELLFVERDAGLPGAICLLGSEGELLTVALSPEEFLTLLGRADTGVGELDDESEHDRQEFIDWLEEQDLELPPTPPDFDLIAFLEGTPLPAVVSSPPAALSPALAELSGVTQRLALLVGRRADDPELASVVSGELGKKLHTSRSSVNDSAWVEAEDEQLNLLFAIEVLHPRYPRLPRSSRTYVPYFQALYFEAGYDGALPFGLRRDMDEEQVRAKLGPPTSVCGVGNPCWSLAVDEARGVVFCVVFSDGEVNMSLQVDAALALSGATPPLPLVGVFVAWAVQRGLFNSALFPEHAELIAEVRAGRARGSQLLQAAFPRGLWDRHLLDRPGLRDFAYDWFHSTNKRYIVDDFVKVFGKGEDLHGHTAAALTDDSAAALAQMAPTLDERFKDWL